MTPFYDYKKSSLYEIIYSYCLMMWDGLTFFDFDETKLNRLRGNKKEVKFTDKFTST